MKIIKIHKNSKLLLSTFSCTNYDTFNPKNHYKLQKDENVQASHPLSMAQIFNNEKLNSEKQKIELKIKSHIELLDITKIMKF